MANKRISELDPLLTPSLTGVTAFSEGDTTYKVTLQGIKNTIIETGSIQTTGTTLYSANPLATTPSNLNTTHSIFFGSGSGTDAPLSEYSVFIGYNSGISSSQSPYSNFIGYEAGKNTTGYTSYNTCIGFQAGMDTDDMYESTFIGKEAGKNIVYPFAEYSNIIGAYSTQFTTRISNVDTLGVYSLAYADDVFYSVAIGYQSGQGITSGSESTYIGYRAGYYSDKTTGSVHVGNLAGFSSSDTAKSVMLGYEAGYYIYNSPNVITIGEETGYNSYFVTSSTFIGTQAGYGAGGSENSNFLGYRAGYNAYSSSYSIFLGWQAGYNNNGYQQGLKRNNIIIGTNVTLEKDRQDSINIGGIIFGTGSHFSTSFPVSGSAGGKIGINKVVPEHHFDVSGSIAGNSHLILSRVSSSLDFVDDAAANAGGVPLGGLYRSGSLIRIRLS